MDKYFQLIASTPLFNGVKESDISAMLNCMGSTRAKYSKGSYIKREGDPADFIGILLSGQAQIIQDDYFGNRHINAVILPGDMFGEAFSCAEVSELPLDILAYENTEVLFLSHYKILHQCSNACAFHNQVVLNLLKVVASKNIMLNRKLKYHGHKTTAEKLLAFLQDQSRFQGSNTFTIPFDRQGLADYLGVERSAMSAEISKLKKQGIIDTKRSWFKIIEH